MKDKLNFYEFSQNDSGGSFVTDDKLCHRLFIEAESEDAATKIAEDLGCYWNGVEEGYDCECCGDRWDSGYMIDLKESNNEWEIDEFIKKGNEESALSTVLERYQGYEWVKEPSLTEKYGSPYVTGKVKIKTIEEYVQVMANLYAWTSPDARIFYKNGEVKEIYSSKIPKK
jgi:hypothetical protein